MNSPLSCEEASRFKMGPSLGLLKHLLSRSNFLPRFHLNRSRIPQLRDSNTDWHKPQVAARLASRSCQSPTLNKAKCGNTAKMHAPTSLAGSYDTSSWEIPQILASCILHNIHSFKMKQLFIFYSVLLFHESLPNACYHESVENLKLRKLFTEYAVSWMRKRDMHILSAGILMYTSDLRFQVIHPDKSENWTLQIKSPQERDSGVYECQVSTEPKMSLNYSLNVVEERKVTLYARGARRSNEIPVEKGARWTRIPWILAWISQQLQKSHSIQNSNPLRVFSVALASVLEPEQNSFVNISGNMKVILAEVTQKIGPLEMLISQFITIKLLLIVGDVDQLIIAKLLFGDVNQLIHCYQIVTYC
ncbi:hypothetical protein WN51_03408 [Melipona quadrifasciata]|uniref:Ig-like domain-containing protein n=1 Tax=Melipona quadrifasciata TaxID=166423 RepID=A0A0M8ZVB8_9HYME|nr:hypothetical protein WN51_03408 [Melipona quadrifasciata]